MNRPVKFGTTHYYLVLSQFFLAFCFNMFNAVLAPYLESQGFSTIILGVLFSITPLVSIFAAPIVGRISDRIGRKEVTLFGIIIGMFGIYLYTLNPYFVFAARVLHALGWVTTLVVFLSWYEDHLDEGDRGRKTGIFFSLSTVGNMLGPFMAGIMADHLFIKAPFYVSIIFLGVFALVILSSKPKVKTKVRRKDLNWFNDVKYFWSKRSLRGTAILGLLVNAKAPFVVIFLALYIVNNFGLSYGYIGLALFIYYTPGITQAYMGKIADNITAKKIIIVGSILMVIGLVLLFMVDDFVIFLLILVLYGLGGAIFGK